MSFDILVKCFTEESKAFASENIDNNAILSLKQCLVLLVYYINPVCEPIYP
jgi:hypothetical protein